MRSRLLLLAAAAVALAAHPAAAQHRGHHHHDDDRDDYDYSSAPRHYLGGELTVASPQGEFHDFVDSGWGGGIHYLLRADRDGWLALRVDASLLNYGHERQRVILSPTIGGRIGVDLTTDNNIAFIGAGPQIGLPTGAFRPYLNGFVGVSYIFTESAVRGFVQGLNAGAPGDVEADLRVFTARPQGNIEQSYGKEFAAALATAVPGEWQALPSKEGLRAIRLRSITPAKPAEFQVVSAAVLQDWTDAVMSEQRSDAVRALTRKYKVVQTGAQP